MTSTCSCRTIALRTFVRSVAQVHIPNDNLARAAPWHEARRQLHQARATRWPAVSGLPYRSIRTAATDSSAAAVQVEEEQTGTSNDEHRLPHDAVVEDTPSLEVAPRGSGDIDMLAREVAKEVAKGSAKLKPLTLAKSKRGKARQTPDLEAPEEKPKKTKKVRESKKAAALDAAEEKPKKSRKGKESKKSAALEAPVQKRSKKIKAMASEAKAESSPKKTRAKQRKSLAPEDVVSEDLERVTTSAEEIDAEQLKKERAERKAARAKAKEEEREEIEIARRRTGYISGLGFAEDPELATISVEEIEAEQKQREEARARARAERKAAREKAKEEEKKEAELAQRRAEKERRQNLPAWAVQREALKAKFPAGWRPFRRLSPDALHGIRALNEQFPDTCTTEVLANKFEVSPEAIRRILKSRWEATPEEEEDRQRRWHNRGVTAWEKYAALGMKPPARWREALGASDRKAHMEKMDQAEERGNEWHGEEMEESYARSPEQQMRVKRRQQLSKRLL